MLTKQSYFVSDKEPVIEVMKAYDWFEIYQEYQIFGIGALKEVSLALLSMDHIDLTKNSRYSFFL